MSYTNFKTLGYYGCIDLETNDLYLTHTSPKYRVPLSTKHVTYNKDDVTIDRYVHEAIAHLAQKLKQVV